MYIIVYTLHASSFLYYGIKTFITFETSNNITYSFKTKNRKQTSFLFNYLSMFVDNSINNISSFILFTSNTTSVVVVIFIYCDYFISQHFTKDVIMFHKPFQTLLKLYTAKKVTLFKIVSYFLENHITPRILKRTRNNLHITQNFNLD